MVTRTLVGRPNFYISVGDNQKDVSNQNISLFELRFLLLHKCISKKRSLYCCLPNLTVQDDNDISTCAYIGVVSLISSWFCQNPVRISLIPRFSFLTVNWQLRNQVAKTYSNMNTLNKKLLLIASIVMLGLYSSCSDSDDEISNPEINKEDEKVFYGNAIFETQSELDEFGKEDYTYIDGSVVIKGNSYTNRLDITNFNALESIKKIEGHLLLVYPSESVSSIDGFNNLKEVTGDVVIKNQTTLKGIDGFQNITTIGGCLIIDTYGIQDINGFNNLESVGKKIDPDNSSYYEYHVFLEGVGEYEENIGLLLQGMPDANIIPSLKNIDGNIILEGYFREVEVLENITNVSGSLVIRAPLDNILCLKNLTRVEQVLILSNGYDSNGDGSLSNLDALFNLEFVGNKISIRGFENLENYCAISDLIINMNINDDEFRFYGGGKYSPTLEDILAGRCEYDPTYIDNPPTLTIQSPTVSTEVDAGNNLNVSFVASDDKELSSYSLTISYSGVKSTVEEFSFNSATDTDSDGNKLPEISGSNTTISFDISVPENATPGAYKMSLTVTDSASALTSKDVSFEIK